MSWKDEARERVKAKREGNTFGLLEGTNCFRICPNKEDVVKTSKGELGCPKGTEHKPYIEFRVHNEVGPDKRMVGCGKDITGKGKCWGCDVLVPALLKKGGEKAAVADVIQAKEKFVVQVARFNLDSKKFSLPKPWWVSTGKGIPGYTSKKRPPLSVTIQSLLASSRYNYEDPVKGYNITIERHGMGQFDTVYDPPDRDESPSKVPQAVLQALKPLEEFVPEYSEELFKAAYYGKKDEEEGDHRGKPKSRRPEPEEVEVEEVEEAEADEAEEVEAEETEFEAEEETEEVETEEVEVEEAEEIEEAEEEVEEAEEEFEPEEEPVKPTKKKAAPAPTKKAAPAPAKKVTKKK